MLLTSWSLSRQPNDARLLSALCANKRGEDWNTDKRKIDYLNQESFYLLLTYFKDLNQFSRFILFPVLCSNFWIIPRFFENTITEIISVEGTYLISRRRGKLRWKCYNCSNEGTRTVKKIIITGRFCVTVYDMYIKDLLGQNMSKVWWYNVKGGPALWKGQDF